MTNSRKLLQHLVPLVLFVALGSAQANAQTTPRLHSHSYGQSYKVNNFIEKGHKYFTTNLSIHTTVTIEGHPSRVVLDRGAGHLKRDLVRLRRRGNIEIWHFKMTNIPTMVRYNGQARAVKHPERIGFIIYSGSRKTSTYFSHKVGIWTTKFWVIQKM